MAADDTDAAALRSEALTALGADPEAPLSSAALARALELVAETARDGPPGEQALSALERRLQAAPSAARESLDAALASTRASLSQASGALARRFERGLERELAAHDLGGHGARLADFVEDRLGLCAERGARDAAAAVAGPLERALPSAIVDLRRDDLGELSLGARALAAGLWADARRKAQLAGDAELEADARRDGERLRQAVAAACRELGPALAAALERQVEAAVSGAERDLTALRELTRVAVDRIGSGRLEPEAASRLGALSARLMAQA